MRTPDLLGLGARAGAAGEKLHGSRAYFVVNRQINPTNICALSCKFCNFSAKPGGRRTVRGGSAYAMSTNQIVKSLGPEIREAHITGALHPDWKFKRCLEIIREIKRARPKIQIKAWTAVEIDWFSKISELRVEKILEQLRTAGVDMLPGGGAEIFSPRVRKILCPGKIGAHRWLGIHRAAHKMGMRTNATMLYEHVETPRERVEHLLMLRGLQDETGGFLSFVPLAYQPAGAVGHQGRRPVLELRESAPATGATEDLRMIAAARLILDNFEHIKAYWPAIGEGTASVGLCFGADDMDGTIGHEKIMHAAKPPETGRPAGISRERMIALIREAGKTPVERDAFYNPVKIYGKK